MSDIEKTCENCKHDIEDVDGEHCWRCIHNAVEMFEPKESEIPIIHGKGELELHDREIRNKAIDDVFQWLCNSKYAAWEIDVDREGLYFDNEFVSFDEIAQQLKDGDVDG